MEYISHPSHEHNLKSLEVDEYADPKTNLCDSCGLPILSSPSYTCSFVPSCDFWLHEACAGGRRDEIKSNHKSHRKHPLLGICRHILCRCDACGVEHSGFFFCCLECDFWIHQDCATLPSFMRLRSHFDHPFFLTYSLPSYMLQDDCCLCKKPVHDRDNGVYFCGECDALAHLTCAREGMLDLTTETRLDLIQLPMEGDTFPSMVISKYLTSHPFYSDDPLIIQIEEEDGVYSNSSSSSSNNNSTKEYLVCDVCIQPIDTSSSYYKIELHESSNTCIFAHDACTHHLRRVKFLFGLKPLLRPVPTDLVFHSTFTCFFCRRPCNGFCHHIDNLSFSYFFDIECLSAPRTINHSSHRKHVLFRLTLVNMTADKISCCSSKSLYFDVYSCTDCDFHIHISCAMLPRLTSHKFDNHPLELITDGQEYVFCEVCEEDIDQKYWYYGCRSCEFYFHINCIPAVGFLSKVKFGETLMLEGAAHAQHPLTLTRMLTHQRHERCGSCKNIIPGYVDEMAFHCYECDFWLHFSCARDSLARTRSKVYSQVKDDYFKMFSPSLKFAAAAIKSLTM